MAKEFDETIVKAWNAMTEAWQMSNFASARKIAINLRPLTMPDWAEKWREFDAMVVESFGGSFPDMDEVEEMRSFVSKLTTEKNRLEHENQSLSEEIRELEESGRSIRAELEKLKSDYALLQEGPARKEDRDDSETDGLLLALNNLRLARKANGHLFHLSKQMQKKLESLGESVTDFDHLRFTGKMQPEKKRRGRQKKDVLSGNMDEAVGWERHEL